jgi:Holliday junction resolvase RusA-like endonuclease
MKEVYRLFIKGRPAAQPRTRKGKYGNIYNPDTADTWKETVQVNILAAGRKGTILRAVELTLYFYFYAPEKQHKAGPHKIKPDGDNLLKAVMDALKNIGVYKDDCQVYLKTVGKFWTNDKENEGMYIQVSEVV